MPCSTSVEPNSNHVEHVTHTVVQPCPLEGLRTVWRRYRSQVVRTTLGGFFGQRQTRFQRPGSADGRPMASEAGPDLSAVCASGRAYRSSCNRTLEEENSGARMRRIRWIADSTYALNVAAQKCNASANGAMANHSRGAWSRVQRMKCAEVCHVRSRTSEPGNECADVLAESGRRGLRWSPCLLDRLLHCVHQRLTRKPEIHTRLVFDFIVESRLGQDRNAGT